MTFLSRRSDPPQRLLGVEALRSTTTKKRALKNVRLHQGEKGKEEKKSARHLGGKEKSRKTALQASSHND